MSYSEAAYFDGDHCAHCAARDEHLRLQHARRHSAETIRLRAASALRPPPGRTADLDGLALFDRARAPQML